jgi:hypothetical protein
MQQKSPVLNKTLIWTFSEQKSDLHIQQSFMFIQ